MDETRCQGVINNITLSVGTTDASVVMHRLVFRAALSGESRHLVLQRGAAFTPAALRVPKIAAGAATVALFQCPRTGRMYPCGITNVRVCR